MLTGTRVYRGALLALIFTVAGGFFSNGLFFLAQPYQRNYGEGLNAWQAAHITDRARAYAPIDHDQFVVFQYPPLFHLAARAVGGDLVTAGRTVSLISAAFLCGVIGWITFQALPRWASGRMRLLAAAFAGVLPTTLYNFSWTWLARVDTLAVLLSFSGVVLFATRPTSVMRQMLACVLMVAALFTRQTALAAPLACVLVAWLIERRIALRLLLTMAILGGGVLTWLAWWSHGQVILHLFRYNQNPFSIARALLGVLMNTRHVAGLLVLAGGASWAMLSRGWALARSRQWDLLSLNLRANHYRRIVFLLAVYSTLAALSSLTFGKEGSDINYFLEWNLALTPLAGILLSRAIPPAGNRLHSQPAWLAALAIPILLLDTGFDQARNGWLRILDGPLPADRQQIEVYRRALATIQEAPGPVFSEDMNLLYKAGKDILAEPAMIQCLAKAGMWDEGPFVRMIREQRFSLVTTLSNEGLLSRERFSPAVASAIDTAYEETSRIGDYRIYRPRRGASIR